MLIISYDLVMNAIFPDALTLPIELNCKLTFLHCRAPKSLFSLRACGQNKHFCQDPNLFPGNPAIDACSRAVLLH